MRAASDDLDVCHSLQPCHLSLGAAGVGRDRHLLHLGEGEGKGTVSGGSALVCGEVGRARTDALTASGVRGLASSDHSRTCPSWERQESLVGEHVPIMGRARVHRGRGGAQRADGGTGGGGLARGDERSRTVLTGSSMPGSRKWSSGQLRIGSAHVCVPGITPRQRGPQYLS